MVAKAIQALALSEQGLLNTDGGEGTNQDNLCYVLGYEVGSTGT